MTGFHLSVESAQIGGGHSQTDNLLGSCGEGVEDHHANLLLLGPLAGTVVDGVDRVLVELIRTDALANAHKSGEHAACLLLEGEQVAVVLSVDLAGLVVHGVIAIVQDGVLKHGCLQAASAVEIVEHKILGLSRGEVVIT